ncbi:helix-turn-helix domain-containing protein [Kordiimonas marina]|uniref:helix-turn-helix domain-containing protein n=1 Tax=Kordiimonas marina TaxID=2872312 RepID=UPI001FF1052D|nr:helix-turn-helix domain-containing protein [Kordiimonas marina]MCJ9429941.1 helix-turn-helix domain-containing protein [Kordiimonas marina]
MKFGDYLKKQREHAGWTQPEAAAKVGIEQSYLSKLETGKSYPSEEVFDKLMKTFGIKLDDLCREVTWSELDKLKEIAQVRSLLLMREQKQARTMRGWLIAGLIMLMTGGGLLGHEAFVSDNEMPIYSYRSPGVIHAGEPLHIFDFMAAGMPSPDDKDGKGDAQSLVGRLDYDFLTLPENRGEAFVKKVEGGVRLYTMISGGFADNTPRNQWIIALGAMLMTGGLASFYISRRWR